LDSIELSDSNLRSQTHSFPCCHFQERTSVTTRGLQITTEAVEEPPSAAPSKEMKEKPKKKMLPKHSKPKSTKPKAVSDIDLELRVVFAYALTLVNCQSNSFTEEQR